MFCGELFGLYLSTQTITSPATNFATIWTVSISHSIVGPTFKDYQLCRTPWFSTMSAIPRLTVQIMNSLILGSRKFRLNICKIVQTYQKYSPHRLTRLAGTMAYLRRRSYTIPSNSTIQPSKTPSLSSRSSRRHCVSRSGRQLILNQEFSTSPEKKTQVSSASPLSLHATPLFPLSSTLPANPVTLSLVHTDG